MFQNCYEEAFPQHSASNISWIGFIQAFPLTGLGVLTGPLYDYDYLRALVTVGSTLKVLGMILTSLCTKYWKILCSQGLLLGLGSGCLFVPSVAVLPTYFDNRERVALGLGAARSAHSLFLPTEPHDRYPAAVAMSPHKSSAPSSTPRQSQPPIQAIGLSLYETLITSGPVEKLGIKVTRSQLLDLSSLEMSSLVGKSVLILDKMEDTRSRTTLEYAVKELKNDIESGE